MTKEAFVLENSQGEISRFIDWTGGELLIVQLTNSRRVVFLNSIEHLKRNDVEYSILDTLTKSEVRKKPAVVHKVGKLSLFNPDSSLVPEIQTPAEDEDRLRQYLGYAAASHVAVLLVILTAGYILNKYYHSNPEPVVVQVFEQDRKLFTEPRQTVTPAKSPVQRKQIQKVVKVAKHTKIVKNSYGKSTNKNGTKLRPGQGSNISNVGALSVLGGMSKKFHGSGGLNLNAKTNNAGIGYGGVAARGGHERGLIGKGLISAGIGDGSSVQGFGGTGTKGLGGGQPGYGSQKMAGSSSAYFQPLSEESVIEGGLDQEQINAVIQRNLGQVIYCYEQGLQSKPNLSGRVAVKFVIGGSGQVNSAQVANTSLASQKVETCIINKLRGWKFPNPVGRVNVRVTYPFLLKRLSQG